MTETKRFSLTRPTSGDVEGVYQICSDPRVWTHFPTLRHAQIEQSRTMLNRWMAGWERDGLGTWVVRTSGGNEVIGYGGCSIKEGDAGRGRLWNLGYRFAFDAQGQGFATELAREAMRQAGRSRPELPIVAYLLEHNVASARVAHKVGLSLVHRGPDAGNPDPTAIRLVYADRALTADELVAVMH